MERTVTILVIDDSTDDRMLYRRALKGAFAEKLVVAEHAEGDGGLRAIEEAEPDCVLLDYSLPGRNGVEVLKLIRRDNRHLPVILLTGQGNEAVAVEAMKEGAHDYITKSRIDAETLGHVVRMAMEHGALEKRVSEQHAALEMFARALAHDLREPVRTVRSFAEMICDGAVESGERDKFMRHIRDAGERMGLLIDTVLSYTQLDGMDAPQHEAIDLNEAVASAQANLSALFNERGTTVSADTMPTVIGNRIQIIQVLQNLMSNAVRHSAKPVHIGIGAARVGEMARIAVQDNGPGIAPEHRRRIFEPFRRLSRDNLHCGLGLTICQKVVKLHGGEIGCDSDVGRGATFYFTIPAVADWSENMDTTSPTETREPAAAVTTANVLLVDDREDDILFTRAILGGPRGMRCNFLIANDGQAGLSTLRERASHTEPVDLVLLDINMPVMDGFEMLEAMRQDETMSRIPVVMCSGSILEQDKERARLLGAIGYLPKPVKFANLQPIIESCRGIRLLPADAGPVNLMRVA